MPALLLVVADTTHKNLLLEHLYDFFGPIFRLCRRFFGVLILNYFWLLYEFALLVANHLLPLVLNWQGDARRPQTLVFLIGCGPISNSRRLDLNDAFST